MPPVVQAEPYKRSQFMQVSGDQPVRYLLTLSRTCGRGTGSPPGIADTYWPLASSPPLLAGPARSPSWPASFQSRDQRPGCHPGTPNTQTKRSLGAGGYSFHQPLKRRRSVHQPEGHYPEFVEPSLCNEGRFLSVCGIHLYLPVSASQVKATEKPCATERVETVLNVRERVGVYLCD